METGIALLATSVTGGAGVWGNIGNIPYHAREDGAAIEGVTIAQLKRGKEANTYTTACGRAPILLSADRFPDTTTAAACCTPTGASAATYNWVLDILHWQDFTYEAYLLTGDYYYLEDELMNAAGVQAELSNSGMAAYASGYSFAFVNPKGAIPARDGVGLAFYGEGMGHSSGWNDGKDLPGQCACIECAESAREGMIEYHGGLPLLRRARILVAHRMTIVRELVGIGADAPLRRNVLPLEPIAPVVVPQVCCMHHLLESVTMD